VTRIDALIVAGGRRSEQETANETDGHDGQLLLLLDGLLLLLLLLRFDPIQEHSMVNAGLILNKENIEPSLRSLALKTYAIF
jgi:hypothetical protein